MQLLPTTNKDKLNLKRDLPVIIAATVKKIKACVFRKPLIWDFFWGGESKCKGSWDAWVLWSPAVFTLLSVAALILKVVIALLISPDIKCRSYAPVCDSYPM